MGPYRVQVLDGRERERERGGVFSPVWCVYRVYKTVWWMGLDGMRRFWLMGTLPYQKKMVLDFKYILLYWVFFFYMYLYNACSITLEWVNCLNVVACQMLNFVYKFAIRVYKSEKHCILHSKHTELYYRTDVKSEF